MIPVTINLFLVLANSSNISRTRRHKLTAHSQQTWSYFGPQKQILGDSKKISCNRSEPKEYTNTWQIIASHADVLRLVGRNA